MVTFIDREKIVKNKIYHILKIHLPLFLRYVKIKNFTPIVHVTEGHINFRLFFLTIRPNI